MAEINPSRQRMIDDMTVHNLSPATQRSYIHAVAKLASFPSVQVRHSTWATCAPFRFISWPPLNQHVCAPWFLYGVTLRHNDLPEHIAHAREPQKLPVILSANEILRFLEAVPHPKYRAALTTAYAAGLRVSEVASLKIVSIDSTRMVIRVVQGKGARDR